MFGWLGRFIAFLWSFSRRSWIDTGIGLRPRSGASALVLFLFLIFFIVGAVLMLLGFDLGEVDRWIDAQSGWLAWVGSLLFRSLCGLGLLICAFTVGGALLDRGNADRPGCGCAFAAAIIGYFLWFGMIGD